MVDREDLLDHGEVLQDLLLDDQTLTQRLKEQMGLQKSLVVDEKVALLSGEMADLGQSDVVLVLDEDGLEVPLGPCFRL